MKLRRFTPAGVTAFEDYLDALNERPDAAPPVHLLTDPSKTESVEWGEPVETQNMDTRLEAGRVLDAVLGPEYSPNLFRDVGLWVWLTLFFFDAVCPPRETGERRVGARARYVPAEEYRSYYRHLLAGTYRVYGIFREELDSAAGLLVSPLDRPGEIVEQITSRLELVSNPTVVEVVTKLYVDSETRTVKRGAAGKQGGSVRRLVEVLGQFDLTWDLYGMTPDQVMSMLPPEFDRFR